LVDPCLWIKHFYHSIVRDLNISEVIEDLQGFDFGLKVENHLKHYLSCQIVANFESKTIYVLQSDLIKNLEGKFGDEIVNVSNYGTPGTPCKTKQKCQQN
jgi:hypothetical protein